MFALLGRILLYTNKQRTSFSRPAIATAEFQKNGVELQFFWKYGFTEGIPKKAKWKWRIHTYVLGLCVWCRDNFFHLSDHGNQMYHRNVLFCHNILYYPHNKPGYLHKWKLSHLVLVLLGKINKWNYSLTHIRRTVQSKGNQLLEI